MTGFYTPSSHFAFLLPLLLLCLSSFSRALLISHRYHLFQSFSSSTLIILKGLLEISSENYFDIYWKFRLDSWRESRKKIAIHSSGKKYFIPLVDYLVEWDFILPPGSPVVLFCENLGPIVVTRCRGLPLSCSPAHHIFFFFRVTLGVGERERVRSIGHLRLCDNVDLRKLVFIPPLSRPPHPCAFNTSAFSFSLSALYLFPFHSSSFCYFRSFFVKSSGLHSGIGSGWVVAPSFF